MRILLTGGTGFVGSRVLRLLCTGENEVTLLVRAQSKIPPELPENVTILRLATLETPFNIETDAVIHLAGPSKWGDLERWETVETALGILDNLLNSVKFRRFVYVSSAAARIYDAGAPGEIYYYALAKKLCERRVELLQNYAILRPGEIYGIDPGFITAGNIVTLRDSPFSTGGRVSICDVESVAQCIVQAANRSESGIFELGGNNVGVRDVALRVKKCFNKAEISLPIPAGVVLFAARHFSRILKLEPEAARYGVHNWEQDSAAACREFGYQIVPYTEIIDQVCAWLQKIGK